MATEEYAVVPYGRSINHLPDEILEQIFSHLSVCDIARAANVCVRWADLLKDMRMWKGRSYESQDSNKADEILLVTGVWPSLISLNLIKRDHFRMSLNVSGATLELPNLTDKNLHRIVSALETKSLCVDVRLLDRSLDNCLAIQTHGLLRLSILMPQNPLDRDSAHRVETNLKALAHTFSSGALPALRTLRISSRTPADIRCDSCAGGEVLSGLAACPDLRQFRMAGCTCTSWKIEGAQEDLKVLSVMHSRIREFCVTGECKNLREVTLQNCPQLKKIRLWDMQHDLNLHTLQISKTNIRSKALDELCRVARGLEVLSIQFCPKITSAAFVRHCKKLEQFELIKWNPENKNFYYDLALLPPGLKHLAVVDSSITSKHLDQIIRRLPMLETLNLSGSMCVKSINFLEYCTDLVELNLTGLCHVPSTSFGILAEMRQLRNLNLKYCSLHSSTLSLALQKMPFLKKLDLSFVQTLSDMFFLNKCQGLRCLNMSHCPKLTSDIKDLRNLPDVRTLRIYGFPGRPFITDLERELFLLQQEAQNQQNGQNQLAGQNFLGGPNQQGN